MVVWARDGPLSSAEVFHEHDVAAAVVLLGIQNPPPIWRNCNPRHKRDRLSVQRGNLDDPASSKAQKLQNGLRGTLPISMVVLELAALPSRGMQPCPASRKPTRIGLFQTARSVEDRRSFQFTRSAFAKAPTATPARTAATCLAHARRSSQETSRVPRPAPAEPNLT